MVKFASWNIRGLNDPLKQREVRSFVKFHALDFICLLETRVRAPNRDRIFSSLFPGGDFSITMSMLSLVESGFVETLRRSALILFIPWTKLCFATLLCWKATSHFGSRQCTPLTTTWIEEYSGAISYGVSPWLAKIPG